MRFQSAHAEVLAEGFQQTSSFSIDASGKAFKALLDGAYSRKIEATIRELGTNALDSHMAAGSIAPFHVGLPVMTRPTFFIRDYGTGMSHDFMMNRFTVMFDSTKDGLKAEDASRITPDQQVGMLGIGRMAFFTSTDSCNITVWQDGEARHYTVFMGSDDVPQVAHAGTSPSDEPTGVKVEFAVRTKDFAEFERAAIRVFKGFPVMPSGLRTKVAAALRVVPSEIGSFWRTFPKDYLEGSVFWARQGCVLYPVDLREIDERAMDTEESVWDPIARAWHTVPSKELSDRYQDFENTSATFIIDFPIGTLDFDLGRERLGYNDRTVLALRKRWNEMLEDMGKKFDTLFEGAKTGWEYMVRAGDDSLNDMGLLFHRTPQYEKAIDQLSVLHKLVAPRRKDRSSKYPVFAVYRQRADKLMDTMYAAEHAYMFKSDTIPTDFSKSMILIRDKKISYLSARVNAFMQANDLNWLIAIEGDDVTPALLKSLGNPPVFKQSELPALPKWKEAAERRGNNGGGGSFHRMKIISNTAPHYDTATDPSQLDGALYAFLNCGFIHNPDPDKYPEYSVMQVIRMSHMLHFFTGRTIALVNIKSNEFDKIEEKWGDLPLFYGCLDGIMDTVSNRDLRDMVAIINHERFANTKYDNYLDRWETFYAHEHTPINELSRFRKRYAKVAKDKTRKAMLTQFLKGNPFDYTLAGEDPPFTLAVIEKALAMGLEILPRFRDRHGTAKYPYPLLPKKWERMGQLMMSMNTPPDKPAALRNRKIVFNAIRSDLGC